MPSPIALLTDFGLADPYVGQMKGALLRHAPRALLVDVSHQVPPCDILQAGFFLAASQAHFPQGTIFVAVVDPGVGSARRIVLAEAFGRFFLAPDNGLLTQLLLNAPGAVVRDVTPAGSSAGGDSPDAGRVRQGVTVHGQDIPADGGQGVAATVHGRDVFAPLAARLANGEAPASLGDRVDPGSLVRLEQTQPVLAGDALTAAVLHVDRFGNCLLNLTIRAWTGRLAGCRALRLGRPEHLEESQTIEIQNSMPLRFVTTYEQLGSGDVGLLAGSQGYLELALNQASAAAVLGLAPGGLVSIILHGQA